MSITGTEPHGMSWWRGGKLPRGIHSFIRLLQLASCCVLFAMMTFDSRIAVTVSSLPPIWDWIVQLIAGVAIVYTLVAMVLAWTHGGVILCTIICATIDFFFIAAFVVLPVLLSFGFFNETGKPHNVSPAWKPAMVSSLIAAALFFVGLLLQGYIHRFYRKSRRSDGGIDRPSSDGGEDPVIPTLTRKPSFWKRVLLCRSASRQRRSRSAQIPQEDGSSHVGPRTAADPQPATSPQISTLTAMPRAPARLRPLDPILPAPAPSSPPHGPGSEVPSSALNSANHPAEPSSTRGKQPEGRLLSDVPPPAPVVKRSSTRESSSGGASITGSGKGRVTVVPQVPQVPRRSFSRLSGSMSHRGGHSHRQGPDPDA